MKFILFIFLLSFIILVQKIYSEPWGKDADLVGKGPICECPRQVTVLAGFGTRAIKFHQEVISPADGPRSNFIPSSSQYTKEAMQKYGFFEGFALGCDRLLRENDEEWVYKKIQDPAGRPVKWNPVP